MQEAEEMVGHGRRAAHSSSMDPPSSSFAASSGVCASAHWDVKSVLAARVLRSAVPREGLWRKD